MRRRRGPIKTVYYKFYLSSLVVLSSQGALLIFCFFSEEVSVAFLVLELLELKQVTIQSEKRKDIHSNLNLTKIMEQKAHLNQKIPDEHPLLLQRDSKIQETTDKLHDLRRLQVRKTG